MTHPLAPLLAEHSIENREVIADWFEDRGRVEAAAVFRCPLVAARNFDPGFEDLASAAYLASLGWAMDSAAVQFVEASRGRLASFARRRFHRKNTWAYVGDSKDRFGFSIDEFFVTYVERASSAPGATPRVKVVTVTSVLIPGFATRNDVDEFTFELGSGDIRHAEIEVREPPPWIESLRFWDDAPSASEEP